MMDGMNTMMGPLMGLMMGYWVVFSLALLVVLVLLAVWLFQQVRPRGATSPANGSPSDRS